MRYSKKNSGIVAVLALLAADSAAAETLTISGWYAAQEREVAMAQSLAVDRFDGDDGPFLQTAMEYALGQGRNREGAPYYTLRSRYGDVDAMVYGSIRTRVDLEDFTRKAKRCAANTSSTKCKDNEKIEIDIACTRRTVMVTAQIRVTRLADDALIHNRTFPQQSDVENCEGDGRMRSVDAQVEAVARSIASQFAQQVTPYDSTDKIRIRESRNGMGKDDSALMKKLIAMTKTDERAACAGWLEMETAGNAHPSVKFNLGLCAEARGALDIALGYYRPLAVDGKGADAQEAIRRVERRMAGEADYVARAARVAKS